MKISPTSVISLDYRAYSRLKFGHPEEVPMLDSLMAIRECFEQKVYILTRNTSAIESISDLDGNTRLGMILQLPEGAEVRVCGPGFNERTVKVCWEGGFYYVFLEDIDDEAAVAAQPLWSYAHEAGA